jgi:GNAT superfamily N-acetyltransferase
LSAVCATQLRTKVHAPCYDSIMPAPLLFELADGTPVLLRTFLPEDRKAVEEAFRRLSRESRYYRFWSRQEEIPDSILNRFLNSRPGHHETWAVQDPASPDEPGYGGGSFWRSDTEPDLAEISLTVADEAQHRGVGTLLLAWLWLRAKAAGIQRLHGAVLADNYTVLDWFRALGATIKMERGQYAFELQLDEALLKDTRAAERLKARLREME